MSDGPSELFVEIVEIEQALGFSFEPEMCDGDWESYLEDGVRKYRCQSDTVGLLTLAAGLGVLVGIAVRVMLA